MGHLEPATELKPTCSSNMRGKGSPLQDEFQGDRGSPHPVCHCLACLITGSGM
jgi:hypothetical protein